MFTDPVFYIIVIFIILPVLVLVFALIKQAHKIDARNEIISKKARLKRDEEYEAEEAENKTRAKKLMTYLTDERILTMTADEMDEMRKRLDEIKKYVNISKVQNKINRYYAARLEADVTILNETRWKQEKILNEQLKLEKQKKVSNTLLRKQQHASLVNKMIKQ